MPASMSVKLTARYPRGGRALLSRSKNFQARDTVAWFESRGVKLNTEVRWRMFPVKRFIGNV